VIGRRWTRARSVPPPTDRRVWVLWPGPVVMMCYGAPASLYTGQHDPRMTLPRIEVACRAEDPDDDDLRTAMSWFARHHTGDMDHLTDEYSSVNDMPVLVPRVVEQAHEASTFVRRRMHQEVESELRRFIADLE